MSKLQKKPSAPKRGHPTLQNMNFYQFFSTLWVIFALLDPDSDSGSGSTDLIESGSNSDPDPQPWGEDPFCGSSLHWWGTKTFPANSSIKKISSLHKLTLQPLCVSLFGSYPAKRWIFCQQLFKFLMKKKCAIFTLDLWIQRAKWRRIRNLTSLQCFHQCWGSVTVFCRYGSESNSRSDFFHQWL